MATKFGIRNFSRTGNSVTFTVVALNANGSIDTGYTGSVSLSPQNMSSLGTFAFAEGDRGQRTFTATIINSASDARVTAISGSDNGGQASLFVAASYGLRAVELNGGDSLFVGGPADDRFRSSSGNDLFLLQGGGNDFAYGGEGDDGFYFGGAFTAGDVVEGGSGRLDQIGLQGNYSSGVTLAGLMDVEMVVLLSGGDTRFGDTAGNLYSYNITSRNGSPLTIQANTLRAGENLTFDGSSAFGNLLIFGGSGVDVLSGGAGNDGFFFGEGRLGGSDVINGGGGASDQLGLQGNFTSTGSGAVTFGAGQLSGIEFIVLLSAADDRFGLSGGMAAYDLTMDDDNLAASQTMVISANVLSENEDVVFNGSAERDGAFRIFSGAGNDSLAGGHQADEVFGGAGNDLIEGNEGADRLSGGAGADQFVYAFAADSTAAAPDQVLDFSIGDRIALDMLANNTGSGGNFTYIGNNAQTGARQVQVIQSGNAATVNVFVDADNSVDMVVQLIVADGHVISAADLSGVEDAGQALLGHSKLAAFGLRGRVLDDPSLSLWVRRMSEFNNELLQDPAATISLTGDLTL